MRGKPRRRGKRSDRTKKIIAGISAGALLILLAYVVFVIPNTNNFGPSTTWTVSENPDTQISSSYYITENTQTWELNFLSPTDYSMTIDHGGIELPIIAGILWDYIPDISFPVVHHVEIWQFGNPDPIEGYTEFMIAESDVMIGYFKRDIYAVGLFAPEPISDIHKIVWTITT